MQTILLVILDSSSNKCFAKCYKADVSASDVLRNTNLDSEVIKVRLHTAINRADFVSWYMLYTVRR